MAPSRVLFAVAAALAVAAGYLLFQPAPGPEPPLVVAPAEVDIGPVVLGPHVVAFRVTNPADRPRRVIGMAEG